MFNGSGEFVERHFYDDQQQATLPISSAASRSLSIASQTPQPAAATHCDFTQHNYDRFLPNNFEYLDLQPFQNGGTGYSWPQENGFVGTVQQAPLNQCVALSGYPPNSAYSPGLEVPYSPPDLVHVNVKCERRPSSSATSSSVDCSAVGFAAELVQTSPSYCDDRQLKHGAFVPLEYRVNKFSISGHVDKDNWTAGRCLSDMSPSSVELYSDAVCHTLFLACYEITNVLKYQKVFHIFLA